MAVRMREQTAMAIRCIRCRTILTFLPRATRRSDYCPGANAGTFGYFGRNHMNKIRYICGANSPDGFGCTCKAGHDGEHIARGARGQVYAVWENKKSIVEDTRNYLEAVTN